MKVLATFIALQMLMAIAIIVLAFTGDRYDDDDEEDYDE